MKKSRIIDVLNQQIKLFLSFIPYLRVTMLLNEFIERLEEVEIK